MLSGTQCPPTRYHTAFSLPPHPTSPSSTGWSESQLQRSGKSPSAAIPEGSFHNQQLSPHLDCYGDCRKTHRKHWKQLSNNQLCRHSIQQVLTGGNLIDKMNQLVTLVRRHKKVLETFCLLCLKDFHGNPGWGSFSGSTNAWVHTSTILQLLPETWGQILL